MIHRFDQSYQIYQIKKATNEPMPFITITNNQKNKDKMDGTNKRCKENNQYIYVKDGWHQ